MKSPLADAWGSWQVRHPFATGLCLNFTLATASPIALWHEKQRSFPAFTRLNLLLAAWGSWHFMQLPSATTLCTLRAPEGTISLWHREQMLVVSAARSLPWDEV